MSLNNPVPRDECYYAAACLWEVILNTEGMYSPWDSYRKSENSTEIRFRYTVANFAEEFVIAHCVLNTYEIVYPMDHFARFFLEKLIIWEAGEPVMRSDWISQIENLSNSIKHM